MCPVLCSLDLASEVDNRIGVGWSFVVAHPGWSAGIDILAGPLTDFPLLVRIALCFDPNNIGAVRLVRWCCMCLPVGHFEATSVAVLGSCRPTPGSPRSRYPMSSVGSTWLQFLEDRVAGLDSF